MTRVLQTDQFRFEDAHNYHEDTVPVLTGAFNLALREVRQCVSALSRTVSVGFFVYAITQT